MGKFIIVFVLCSGVILLLEIGRAKGYRQGLRDGTKKSDQGYADALNQPEVAKDRYKLKVDRYAND